MIRRWRPEVDVYLTTDRDVGSLAGSDEAAPLRRVFYGTEEPMEIHLTILDGVKDRYDTPYFDNLKNYASRPIGPSTPCRSPEEVDLQVKLDPRHGRVLWRKPVPRGVVGNHRWPRQPAGADRQHQGSQDKAARALGGDRSFFVTNGTSTSNKIVHQALLAPGDIVLIDRDCHKSHHYGLVLAGASRSTSTPSRCPSTPCTAALRSSRSRGRCCS